MTLTTAVLLTVLCAATEQGPTPTADSALTFAAASQQATSGIVVAAEIEGRLAIYRAEHQLVVKIDKPAGRPLQIALAPGAYEARLGERGSRRVRFQLAEGDQFPIDLASLEAPEAATRPATGPATVTASAHPPSAYRTRALDPRHRIEVRFGGSANGWYGDGHDWHASGSTRGAFGFEYLNLVSSDLGIGIAVTGLVHTRGDWDGWEHAGSAQVVSSIPVVARWYPIRRVTSMRTLEPYVTAGIGPVFGVDAQGSREWHRGDGGSARVGTTLGGRVGGGIDVRLGSVFTLGMAGAWNWNAGLPDDLWKGSRPEGGEFTVALGWTFGR